MHLPVVCYYVHAGLTPLNVNANNSNDTTELPADLIAQVVEGSPVLSHDPTD